MADKQMQFYLSDDTDFLDALKKAAATRETPKPTPHSQHPHATSQHPCAGLLRLAFGLTCASSCWVCRGGQAGEEGRACGCASGRRLGEPVDGLPAAGEPGVRDAARRKPVTGGRHTRLGMDVRVVADLLGFRGLCGGVV